MPTVSINKLTHKELKSLCKMYQITIIDFIQHGVNYFKQTGINPEHVPLESPRKAIRELTLRVEQIIGVVKTHEHEKLNPLLEHIMMLCRRIELLLNDAPKESTFKVVLTRIEDVIDEDKKRHVEQLRAQEKHYKLVMDADQKILHEIMSKMDKMTAEQERIKEAIETRLK